MNIRPFLPRLKSKRSPPGDSVAVDRAALGHGSVNGESLPYTADAPWSPCSPDLLGPRGFAQRVVNTIASQSGCLRSTVFGIYSGKTRTSGIPIG